MSHLESPDLELAAGFRGERKKRFSKPLQRIQNDGDSGVGIRSCNGRPTLLHILFIRAIGSILNFDARRNGQVLGSPVASGLRFRFKSDVVVDGIP